MVKSTWRVAAAQYPIEALADWDAYAAKLTRWVAQAVAGGAMLAVFPEYAAMELASLDPVTMGDLQGSIETVSALLPRVDALHAALSRDHGIWILAGSAPRKLLDGRFVNTARLFSPDGRAGYQDKLMMTRFEREEWGIVGGQGLGRIGRGDRLFGPAHRTRDTELGPGALPESAGATASAKCVHMLSFLGRCYASVPR